MHNKYLTDPHEVIDAAIESTKEILDEMESRGEIESKLCFAYCGEDRCNCRGGAYMNVYMQELDKQRKIHEQRLNSET